jgi:hypothetical protein
MRCLGRFVDRYRLIFRPSLLRNQTMSKCRAIPAKCLVWSLAMLVPVSTLPAFACNCALDAQCNFAGASFARAHTECLLCAGRNASRASHNCEQHRCCCGKSCCCKGGVCRCSANKSAPAPLPANQSRTHSAKSSPCAARVSESMGHAAHLSRAAGCIWSRPGCRGGTSLQRLSTLCRFIV